MKSGILLVWLMSIMSSLLPAQTTKVLFIGNSYTDVNNLPALFQSVAAANGDNVTVDKNAPGGYTFELHSMDPNTIAKIYSQPWDYVVLQEQSQLPSFPPSQVSTDVYPFAAMLDSMIQDNNQCTETVFYMTWGRKNGDASNCGNWPPVCTYEGMQARLRESYVEMAQLNYATVGPVGAAWRYIRSLNPAFDLYQPDESHPSIHGSYLAACALYAAIFHKEPLSTSFTATLPLQDAIDIQNAVVNVVNDSIAQWYAYGSIPIASFSYIGNGNDIQFQNHSLNVSSYIWDFGDGNSSTNFNTTHTYQQPGTYTVTLTVTNGCKLDVIVQQVTTGTTALENLENNCSFTIDRSSKQLIFDCGKKINEVQILDLAGRLLKVLVPENNKGRSTVQLPGLAAGTYIIHFSGQYFHRTSKYVVN